ncbi:MAG: sigma factor G inhibitor Gin [Clostridium sp.]|uniref:sigma factor G inhibitor Gin n=1 Tax=Clostridium sp. TaxID=1506 RepID=UPI002FCB690D
MKSFVNKKIQENTCVICGHVSDNGIIIKGEMICPMCEVDIVNVTPGDPKYNTYVEGIKNILD